MLILNTFLEKTSQNFKFLVILSLFLITLFQFSLVNNINLYANSRNSDTVIGFIDSIHKDTGCGGNFVRVTGWFADLNTSIPVNVNLRINNTTIATNVSNLARPDVVTYLNQNSADLNINRSDINNSGLYGFKIESSLTDSQFRSISTSLNNLSIVAIPNNRISSNKTILGSETNNISMASSTCATPAEPVNINNRNVKWKGRSYKFNQALNRYENYHNPSHDDWQNIWLDKDCPAVANSGILTRTCNLALREADGRGLFAFRVRYFKPLNDNPNRNSILNNLNLSTDSSVTGIVYKQVFYTYHNGQGFVEWFAFDQNGNRVSINNPSYFVSVY